MRVYGKRNSPMLIAFRWACVGLDRHAFIGLDESLGKRRAYKKAVPFVGFALLYSPEQF